MELTESLLTETEEVPEATFGTGRLLGIFFALVLVCALFFGFGYTLGRSTGVAQAATIESMPASPATTDVSNATKPSAAAACTGSDCTGAAPQDLTFYKAVEQKDGQPALTKPTEEKAEQPVAEKPKSPTVMTTKMPAGFVVQVAALTKRGDADAMVKALNRKNYPVFVMNAPGDRYFRVQVGPYPTRAEADMMQDRLRHDGYKAIVKR